MFLDPFLDDVHFINFAFDGLCFWSHITLHKAQSPESHLLFFFLKVFIVSHFTLKPMIYFEQICVQVEELH